MKSEASLKKMQLFEAGISGHHTTGQSEGGWQMYSTVSAILLGTVLKAYSYLFTDIVTIKSSGKSYPLGNIFEMATFVDKLSDNLQSCMIH